MGYKLEHFPPNVQERIKAQIAQEDAQAKVAPLAGLSHPKPEPGAVPALAGRAPKQKRGSGSVVLCVTIVSVRNRRTDSDNISAKGLRDCIARSLNCDDGDPRIRWQVEQTETRGREGTIVLIEHL